LNISRQEQNGMGNVSLHRQIGTSHSAKTIQNGVGHLSFVNQTN
jgi:hypothetical protein